jgi:hypothetical protein
MGKTRDIENRMATYKQSIIYPKMIGFLIIANKFLVMISGNMIPYPNDIRYRRRLQIRKIKKINKKIKTQPVDNTFCHTKYNQRMSIDGIEKPTRMNFDLFTKLRVRTSDFETNLDLTNHFVDALLEVVQKQSRVIENMQQQIDQLMDPS